MKDKDYKVAIIGTESVITGFKALGVIPFVAKNNTGALVHLNNIRDGENDYAVVIIMEDLARSIPSDDFKKATQGALPAVITLPSIGADSGYGEEKLKALAEKALGASIF